MKKILIVAKAMESGGVEVSLLNLLNELKKYNYLDLTLLLEKKTGKYLKDIPSAIKVKTLEYKKNIYSYTFFTKKDIKEYLRGIEVFKAYLSKFIIKIYKIMKKNFENEVLLKNVLEETEKYDIVIDFHGYGYFMSKYIAKKIKASKKVMFVHDEKMDWFQEIKEFMNEYDKFYCVSNSVKDIFDKKFSQYAYKSDIFHNIIPKEKIVKLADEKVDILDNNDRILLLTIGRLEYQKGYDLLLKVAKKMKNENENFIWYIIGTGSLEKEIEENIKKEKLEKNIKMLGMKKNPYPYLKKCDIYVQPSRHEGYGIAIAEARCLNKPIVATDLECIREQIQNDKTGILCKFEVDEFKKNIKLLIHDKERRLRFENNLKESQNEEKTDIKKILEL